MILKTIKWSKQQEAEFDLYFCKKAIRAVAQRKIGKFLCSLLFRIAFIIQKHPTPHLLLQISTGEEQWRWGNSPLRTSKNHAQFLAKKYRAGLNKANDVLQESLKDVL